MILCRVPVSLPFSGQRIAPGATALTRTLGASAAARERVRLSKAALDAQYAAWDARGRWA